jgi:hypothetical protein
MQRTPIQAGEYSFAIVVEPNEPDVYLVTCPGLPGLVTEGDDVGRSIRDGSGRDSWLPQKSEK